MSQIPFVGQKKKNMGLTQSNWAIRLWQKSCMKKLLNGGGEIYLEMESARKYESYVLVSNGAENPNMGCFVQKRLERSKSLLLMLPIRVNLPSIFSFSVPFPVRSGIKSR
jgi:hypothetical protein